VEVPGTTVTPTGGFRVTAALAVFVVSVTLVAVTVTVCCEVKEDGAE
jgi:hypothetical protein